MYNMFFQVVALALISSVSHSEIMHVSIDQSPKNINRVSKSGWTSTIHHFEAYNKEKEGTMPRAESRV